jgi:gluconokinase
MTAIASQQVRAKGERMPVLVVMGVSGVGKTTLATLVAQRLGWPFEEGDALHPEANVAKMAAGHPLTDADRRPWLERVAGWIDERLAAGEAGVITCSALKRSYRDILRRPGVVFVHITGPKQVTAERLAARQGHFMPPTLLDSQLATLEPLGPDENGFEVSTTLTREQQVDEVVARLDAA